jgi:lysozyme
MTALTGVDVSSYNGLPRDWQPVAGPISFAAVKFTEYQPGGFQYVNPDAAADWAALQAAGHARIGYLYAHPSTSIAETVGLFASVADKLGLDDGDGIAVDLEVNDGRTPLGADGVKPAAVNAWAHDVLAALRARFSRMPLVYTDLAFALAGNCASLGGYPLWIADPSSPEGHPRIPAPWTHWAIHQYVTGGKIDRDVANYPDLATMRKALGKTLVTHGWVTTAGKGSLGELCAARGVHPSTVLRMTAEKSPGGVFADNVAAYENAVHAASTLPMPEGLRLLLP